MAKWQIDSEHASASFKLMHMGLAWVRGQMYGIKGEVEYDPEQPEASAFRGTLDTTTLTTGHKQRDGHVTSPDFLDVEKYPTISFESTNVGNINNNEAKVLGKLTIKGITK